MYDDDQRTCFNKAAHVGGMLLIVLLLQKKSFLHSFLVRQFDVQLYKNTVNLSIIGNESWIRDKNG